MEAKMEIKSRGTISVCLLTYNHVNVIESTVESILKQSRTNFELVLSDDCSNDGTYEKLLLLAEEDSRIRVIKTPKNMGMAGNANFAVMNSTGAYIALLHHDDIYRHDLLEKWAEILDKYPTALFVFNSYGRFGQNEIDGEPMPGDLFDGRWLLEHYLFPRWGCLIRGTAMIRRAAWQKCGGMQEKFGLLADIDLWMRLSMLGGVGYVSEPIITVRHARPDYYPEIYQSREWSWPRLVYLYEIHAENRLSYYQLRNIGNSLRWFWFRVRLSLETLKWITYAIVRKKLEMLKNCKQSETKYELWPLIIYRKLAVFLFG